MTLNQVIKRVQDLATAHKQIRSFGKGLIQDFLVDKTTRYPAVFLQDIAGNISLGNHATALSYRLFIVDLVHVSADAKTNEQDVQSDMVSIAMDLLAQMNNPQYNDWAISSDNNLQLLVENDGDMHAGVVIDFSVRIMFEQNICVIPTDITGYPSTENDMKFIYDTKYVAAGSEGTTLSIPEIVGKKILLITRESAQLYKVSSNPISSEFTWNDTVIGLGAAATIGERFLILYRNY